MTLKTVKRLNQTFDLSATIHGSYVKGHSLAGAIESARERYPKLPNVVIANLAAKIYGERKAIDKLLDRNFGYLTNVQKSLQCPGSQIRFNVYITFQDPKTGHLKTNQMFVTVAALNNPISISNLVHTLRIGAENVLERRGYGKITWHGNATAREFIASGALRILGFECV